jgi:energy-coupling factor transporter ATP-binding protein EcfA2
MKKFTVRPKAFATSPAEFGMHGHTAKHWVWLGRLGEAGPITNVRFDTDHAHVIGLFGKRGSGKSYTLGTLLEGLCTKESKSIIADNSRSVATLLFDTLGIFQWIDIALDEKSRKETMQQQFAARRGWDLKSEPLDVAIWIPRGTREPDTPPTHTEFTINCSDFAPEDWGYLFGLDIYQDRMGQLLNDAYAKVTIDGWNEGDSFHKPSNSYSLASLIKCVESDKELIDTYADETRRALRQQLSTFQRNPIFQPNGTPLPDLLKPGLMSVIVMNKMSDELRLVVVAAFLRRLIASRIRASEAEKTLKLVENLAADDASKLSKLLQGAIPPTWVAIDEAQNVLPSEYSTMATDVIVKYVREGRNYGLSFVIATQQPTSVDPRILAQVDTLITHKLTVQGDIDYIRRNLKSKLPEEVKFANTNLGLDELLRSLDIGQALISNTETDRSFILDIRPRVSVHGGF